METLKRVLGSCIFVSCGWRSSLLCFSDTNDDEKTEEAGPYTHSHLVKNGSSPGQVWKKTFKLHPIFFQHVHMDIYPNCEKSRTRPVQILKAQSIQTQQTPHTHEHTHTLRSRRARAVSFEVIHSSDYNTGLERCLRPGKQHLRRNGKVNKLQ